MALDDDAFAAAFERHAAPVHRFLARRVGTDAADDLLGEAFAQAYASRARFDPERGDVRPWLFGVATNVMRRHRRRERTLWRAYARAGVDPLGVDAVVRDDERRVAAALAALPARDRDALLLFAWAELTYEEIATAMGVPIGTVRSRIARARTRLRRDLADLAGFEIEGEPA